MLKSIYLPYFSFFYLILEARYIIKMSIFIQSDKFCLLIEMFRPFTFHVTIYMVRFKVTHLAVCFLFFQSVL